MFCFELEGHVTFESNVYNNGHAYYGSAVYIEEDSSPGILTVDLREESVKNNSGYFTNPPAAFYLQHADTLTVADCSFRNNPSGLEVSDTAATVTVVRSLFSDDEFGLNRMGSPITWSIARLIPIPKQALFWAEPAAPAPWKTAHFTIVTITWWWDRATRYLSKFRCFRTQTAHLNPPSTTRV